jgi:acetolactate synthase regulatory subunit
MQKYDAWLRIKNNDGILEQVLRLIRAANFTVSSLRLSRSLDQSFYHLNIEIEGPHCSRTLYEQLAVLSDVEKMEFHDQCGPTVMPTLADTSG